MCIYKIMQDKQYGIVSFIRVLTIDNEPWFVGKDVAEKLGYTRLSKSIVDHVAEDDRIMLDKTQSQNGTEFDYRKLGQRGGWIINESGLYSLILSSKLPTAKKFKRWITSESLLSVRKHGAYMTDFKQDKGNCIIERLYYFLQSFFLYITTLRN